MEQNRLPLLPKRKKMTMTTTTPASVLSEPGVAEWPSVESHSDLVHRLR